MQEIILLMVKVFHPIIFASIIFPNSHLIQTAADFVYISESNDNWEKYSTQRW